MRVGDHPLSSDESCEALLHAFAAAGGAAMGVGGAVTLESRRVSTAMIAKASTAPQCLADGIIP